jgi:hypothetical protein
VGNVSWHTLGPLIPIEQRFHALRNSGCSGGKGVYLVKWSLSVYTILNTHKVDVCCLKSCPGGRTERFPQNRPAAKPKLAIS